ncbi:MAG: hypothetical protein KTR22_05095 [Flavobacteriaceae bacterium]|nr:hypothetical protein [Flavobacteriaceae bacterium]
MPNNRRLIILLCISAILLLIPLVAMQFTDEVQWDAMDFAFMGALLLGFVLALEFTLRRIRREHRPWIIIIAVVLLLLIWAEMAVGLFGTPLAGS